MKPGFRAAYLLLFMMGGNRKKLSWIEISMDLDYF
jgi:hypothetical protein